MSQDDQEDPDIAGHRLKKGSLSNLLFFFSIV